MATLKVKPLGGRVLVKPLEEEEVTASGLIIPDTAEKEKPQQGKVMALGTGKVSDDGNVLPFHVKAGDIVVFKKYSPDEIEIDDEEYLVIDEEEILAILN